MPYGQKKRTKSKAVRRAKLAAPKKATVAAVTHQNIGKSIGFPPTKTVTMKYCEWFTISGVTGAMGKYSYQANGIYDPRTAIGGHQPFGYDQTMNYYNHASVSSSVIKVTVLNGTSNVTPVVGVYLSDDTSNYLDWQTFNETNRGSQKLVVWSTNQDRPTTLTCKFDHKKFFNKRPLQAAEFLNTTSANASEEAIFEIYVQDLKQTSSVDIVGFVEILYVVELSEPKDLPGS